VQLSDWDVQQVVQVDESDEIQRNLELEAMAMLSRE
jgi:hypothetical protein